MRAMMTGFTGWIKFEEDRSATVRSVDTMLTVVGTLMLAATWALLHAGH